MAEFPGIEEIAKKVAETALDSFEYQGKTIREWIKVIIEQGWIPVSSGKLPKDGQRVFILLQDGRVYSADFYCCNNDWWFEKDNGWEYNRLVKAWMSIPEFKEGAKDETTD